LFVAVPATAFSETSAGKKRLQHRSATFSKPHVQTPAFKKQRTRVCIVLFKNQ
jgi:hypothetical protein